MSIEIVNAQVETAEITVFTNGFQLPLKIVDAQVETVEITVFTNGFQLPLKMLL